MGKYIHKATTHLGDSQQAAKEFIYGAINERDFDGVMRLLQKCYASTDQEYKKKEVTECARYIKNNWLEQKRRRLDKPSASINEERAKNDRSDGISG